METKNFTIYFTSDLHGYIYPTDYRSREERDIGLFKCASQFRKDGNTLIIDGGDISARLPSGRLLSRHAGGRQPVCRDDEPLRL